MRVPVFLSSVVFAAGLVTSPAVAAPFVLDFPTSACAVLCTNGSDVLQSYGDIPGELDVIYDGNTTAPGLQNVKYWGTGYETLPSVAYSQGATVGMSITFDPAPGFTVTLFGFDLAPYLDRIVNTAATVSEVGGGILFNQTYAPLSTDGVTTETGPWSSASGLVLEFAAPFWNAGVSNIRYEVAPTSGGTKPIPIPAAGWLLGAALIGLGAIRRRP